MDKNLTKPPAFYFGIVVILFALAIAVGLLIAYRQPQQAYETVSRSVSGFRYLHNLSAFDLFLFIFLHNSTIALLMILFGFFFGLVPLYFTLSNAILIGYVAAISTIQTSALVTLAALAPHGIFELTGVLAAAGYGLWLGAVFTQRLRHKKPFGRAFVYAIKRYFTFILPILLVAALIEAYITPRIIQLALNH